MGRPKNILKFYSSWVWIVQKYITIGSTKNIYEIFVYWLYREQCKKIVNFSSQNTSNLFLLLKTVINNIVVLYCRKENLILGKWWQNAHPHVINKLYSYMNCRLYIFINNPLISPQIFVNFTDPHKC